MISISSSVILTVSKQGLFDVILRLAPNFQGRLPRVDARIKQSERQTNAHFDG